jgi:peptidylprolyl isomerase
VIRRPVALLLTVLLATVLVACGDDSEAGGGASEGGSSSLEGVAIEGEVGQEPEVTWDGELTATDVESEVVTEGDGAELGEGDQVFAQIWLGNGTTQEQAYSTYEADQPQLLTVSQESLSELFLQGVEGQTVGSRVAVAASAETAFGPQGNPQVGIGNKDTVLTVIDLLGTVADGPEGTEQKAPSWVPSLVGDDEAPTGVDFAGTPKPTGKLQTAVLVEGEGEVVEKGQTIAVDYLGQVYGGKEPFDESYSSQPTSFPIGVGQVVKGWDQALVGQTVGSRVVLAIPPELGYGDAGNQQAGIKGTDTLYFVVDILGAA